MLDRICSDPDLGDVGASLPPDEKDSVYGEVPKERRDRLLHKVTITNAAKGSLIAQGYCETYRYSKTRLSLTGFLCDTSDRRQGVLLKQCWTWCEQFEIGGIIIWAISPIYEWEKAVWEKGGKQ